MVCTDRLSRPSSEVGDGSMGMPAMLLHVRHARSSAAAWPSGELSPLLWCINYVHRRNIKFALFSSRLAASAEMTSLDNFRLCLLIFLLIGKAAGGECEGGIWDVHETG